jgi:HWE histidine kinase
VALSLQVLVSRDNVHPVEPLIGGIACVVVPALVRLALMPALGAALPFATFFPLVLLATLLWGWRWGAIVLISAGFVAVWLFVQPNEGRLIGLQAARKADAARKSELQHRLKNTLAIVLSFSAYLSRKTTDKAEYERLLETKIIALAKASEILFAESFESCTLSDIANGALAPFTQQGRISIQGPEIQLGADSWRRTLINMVRYRSMAATSMFLGQLQARTCRNASFIGSKAMDLLSNLPSDAASGNIS